jgi:uncharacterized protein (DUF1697 family)
VPSWIAFFRGINVGGNNALSMRDLTTILETLDCHNVRTYIQSGNAVFQHADTNPTKLGPRIEKAVLSKLGFAPSVVALSLKELEQAAASNPFPQAAPEPKSLHLFLLAAKPTNPDIKRLNVLKAERESFILSGRVFYLYAPDGIRRSRLAGQVDKCIGVKTTARNWRTILKVMEMARESAGTDQSSISMAANRRQN